MNSNSERCFGVNNCNVFHLWVDGQEEGIEATWSTEVHLCTVVCVCACVTAHVTVCMGEHCFIIVAPLPFRIICVAVFPVLGYHYHRGKHNVTVLICELSCDGIASF